MTTIKGNYELRIAIINLDNIESVETKCNIHNQMEDTDFLEVAEQLGTVLSLGTFIEEINNQELDDFSNSYVRAFLVNVDEPNEIIGIDDFNSLYLSSGAIEQV